MDHLGDLPGVHLAGPQPVGQAELAAHGPAQGGEPGGLPEQGGHGGALLDRQPALGEGQQLAGQPGGAQAGLLRRGQAGEAGIARRHGHLDQGQVGHDAGEQVVEIMGDAACEQADRFQLVHPVAVLFDPLALGHVIQDQHHAFVAPLAQHRPGGARHGQETTVREGQVGLEGYRFRRRAQAPRDPPAHLGQGLAREQEGAGLADQTRG